MPDPSYVVTGGGGAGLIPAVDQNGDYTVSGTYNGKDTYSNGTCTMRWAGGAVGWEIRDDAGGGQQSYSSGPDPDSAVWSVGPQGEAPAPTVTAYSGGGGYNGGVTNGGALTVGIGDGLGKLLATVPVALYDGVTLVATVLTNSQGLAGFTFLPAWRDDAQTQPITYTVIPAAAGDATGYGFAPAQAEVTPGLPPYVSSVLIQMAPGTWPSYPSPLRSYYEIARYAGIETDPSRFLIEGAGEPDANGTYVGVGFSWQSHRPPLYRHVYWGGYGLQLRYQDLTLEYWAWAPYPIDVLDEYDAEAGFTVQGSADPLYHTSVWGTPPAPTFTFIPGSLTQVAAALFIGWLALAEPHAISGTVTQDATGVSGLHVGLHDATGTRLLQEATTDGSGDYSFAAVNSGTYVLKLTDAGYTTSPASRTAILSGTDITGQDFAIIASPVTLTLAGTVTLDASPLEGVTVTCTGQTPQVTGGDGTFSFTGLVPGNSYQLVATLAGYTFAPVSYTYAPLNASATGQGFAATAVPVTYHLQGTVEYDSAGLAGVLVSATKDAVTIERYTTAAGTYDIPGCEAGVWTVSCLLAGYTFTGPLTPEITDADETGVDFTASLASAPTVVITAPADAATVAGAVTVEGTTTENVTLDYYVDGNLQHTDTPGVSPFSWTWDATAWANGSHTILVVATDASAQTGSDSVTVTVENTVANQELVLFTLPLPGAFANWRLDADHLARLGEFVVPRQTIPAEVADRYNVTLYYGPGTSVDLADYTVIPTIQAASGAVFTRAFRFLPATANLRFAMKTAPQVVWGYWESTSYAALTQIVPLSGGGICCLATGANALLRANLTLWEEIPLTTVVGAVGVAGKVIVAGDDRLWIKDVDSGQLNWGMMPAGVTTVDAICAEGDTAYFATDEGANGYQLYSFTYPDMRALGELVAQATTLFARAGVIYAGCADGHLYSVPAAGGTVTDLLDTGESGISRIWWDGALSWAGASTSGKLFRTAAGVWVADNTFTTPTDIRALAEYAGAMYLAGNSADLWRLDNSTWSNWATLTDVVVVNDALGNADGLYLAVQHDDGARLLQLTLAAAGGFVTGSVPPDFLGKIIAYV